MDIGIELLRRLKEGGYFQPTTFDPAPIFQVCRRHLGIDVTSREQDERLTSVINGLVQSGLIKFEYSSDPRLHPKDSLDHWRLFLTAAGAAMLEEIMPNHPPPPTSPSHGGSS